MQHIDIKVATEEQLRTFAVETLGADITGDEDKKTLLGVIAKAGYGLDKIAIPVPVTVEAKVRAGPAKRGQTRKGKNGEEETLILLHTSEAEGGDQPVFVGVQGVGILIPRGSPEWVPTRFVGVLDNAMQEVFGKRDKGLQQGRLVHRFPYSYA